MAYATRICSVCAIAACDAIVDEIDVGTGTATFNIYAGTQPADPDTAVTTQTLLAQMNLPNPAFGGAADATGKATATAQSTPYTDSSANATGTATWFRIIDRNADAVIDGTVGTSGCDLNLNTTSIQASAEVQITSWTFSVNETEA